MKNKNKIILVGLIFVGGLGVTLHSLAEMFSAKGIFKSQFVDQDFILESSRPNIDPDIATPMIEKYILSVNPKRDKKNPNDISTKDLAKRIAGVSYCFNIDPFVFTSLIHRESINYNQRAISPTGAVGLTQFTTIAIQEVSDQLGQRGSNYALDEATNYFKSIITNSCLEIFGGFTQTGNSYVPLWDLKPANLYTKATTYQAYQMANMMASYPEYALIYGAILLKLNFSLVENGWKTGCFSYKNGRPETLRDKFREVVMSYNGDGCETQKLYQKFILDVFYPRLTGVEAK